MVALLAERIMDYKNHRSVRFREGPDLSKYEFLP